MITDTGLPILNFIQMSPRDFERLCYELLQVQNKKNLDIQLMPEGPDKGKDIILTNGNGKIEKVVQCKRYSKNLRQEEVILEFLRFLLEHSNDIERNFKFEIWVSSGFAPSFYPIVSLDIDYHKILEKLNKKYSNYKHVRASKLRSLLRDYINNLKLVDGDKISQLVRENQSIHEKYFLYKKVVSYGELKEALNSLNVDPYYNTFKEWIEESHINILENIFSYFNNGHIIKFSLNLFENLKKYKDILDKKLLYNLKPEFSFLFSSFRSILHDIILFIDKVFQKDEKSVYLLQKHKRLRRHSPDEYSRLSEEYEKNCLLIKNLFFEMIKLYNYICKKIETEIGPICRRLCIYSEAEPWCENVLYDEEYDWYYKKIIPEYSEEDIYFGIYYNSLENFKWNVNKRSFYYSDNNMLFS